MSNTEQRAFTPGPWYQCGDEVLIDMGDRSHLVAAVADWSEDTEPYARLIAAAPDLYEALKAICDEQDARQGYASVEAYDRARAALTRATTS